VVKNKIAPPFKEAEFDIMYGKGISREGDILDLAADIDVINKSGSWYSYDGNKIGQGRESTKTYLAENPDKMAEIEKKVREFYHLQTEGLNVIDGKLLEENFDEVPEEVLNELKS
jgi:recombination protein RecA